MDSGKWDPQLQKQNQRLLRRLNTTCLNDQQIRQLLSEIFGYEVDESNQIFLPFYSDYGRRIKMGKRVFISCNVMMADRGGIRIGDDVSIGPGTTLLTADGIQTGPITIDSHVKISGHVMILPNVHIGSYAVIGAGTVITHNIGNGEIVTRKETEA